MSFPPFYMLSSYFMVNNNFCDYLRPYLLHQNSFFVIIINCIGGYYEKQKIIFRY